MRAHDGAIEHQVTVVAILCQRREDPRAWKSQLEGSASEVFGSGSGTPAIPAIDVKSLHAKIGELTLENDSDQFGQTSPKIKGRKRHLLADTAGFLIAGIVMKPAYKIATAHPRFSS